MKPRQADLKRAISTAYYALFHAMAKDAADMLVGVGADRPDKAWTQLYRALQHGDAKNAIKLAENAMDSLRASPRRDRRAFAVQNLARKRN